jgi:hypothetical protein
VISSRTRAVLQGGQLTGFRIDRYGQRYEVVLLHGTGGWLRHTEYVDPPSHVSLEAAEARVALLAQYARKLTEEPVAHWHYGVDGQPTG